MTQQRLQRKVLSMLKKDCDEHEIDYSNVYGCDWDYVSKFKAMCCHIMCKKCGCKGITVDDTGTFWGEELEWL